MSGRASHQFIKRKCETNTCCQRQDGFSANDPNMDTMVNVIKTRTRASCCFSVPIDICDFYGATGCGDPGDTTPNDGVFSTDPNHISITQEPTIPPGSVTDGLVFRVESFFTTNRGGLRDLNAFIPGAPQGLDAQEHVEEPFNVTILRQDASASSALIHNHPDSFIVDTPMETLNGGFALGSLDFLFRKIFETYDGLLLPQQIGSLGHESGFLSLTNPNEFEFGTPNVVQIIWPENIDWTLQFVGPNNKRYVYSAVSRKNHPSGETQCNVTETDLNNPANPTVQLNTFACTKAWAIPCDPIEYITTRHQFDMSFPGTTGCTGITDGVVCVDEMTIENFGVRLKNRECLCDTFLDDSSLPETSLAGLTGPEANGRIIVDLLNKHFQSHNATKGWLALNDIQYGYIRIVHPDNILFFDITLTKNFFKAGGVPCAQCNETQSFKQGGLTVFRKPNEDFETVITSTNNCIMNGQCWSSESDMRGCFLLDTEL